MAEADRRPEAGQEDQAPYTPASPVKRIAAWVGLAYMVVFVLLNVYPFFHGGVNLRGVGPLLVCPGAAGLGAISLYLLRRSAGGKRLALILLTAVCAALFLLGLVDGLPALLAGPGGAA